MRLRVALRRLPIPFAIDHFGRTQAARGADDPGFAMLCDMLAAGEVYAKISSGQSTRFSMPRMSLEEWRDRAGTD